MIFAILAGALATPLIYGALILFVTAFQDPGRVDLDLSLVVLMIAVVVGFPMALVGILILFGPVWLWLHRRQAPFAAFLVAGVLFSTAAGVFIPVVGAAEPVMTGLFALSSALSTALMWWIAYGDRNLPCDPRDLPQANFEGVDPST